MQHKLLIFHSTPYRLLIFSIGIFCIFSRCYNFDFRIHARINLQFRPSRQMATVWIVLFISWNVLDFMALQGTCPFLNIYSCVLSGVNLSFSVFYADTRRISLKSSWWLWKILIYDLLCNDIHLKCTLYSKTTSQNSNFVQ